MTRQPALLVALMMGLTALPATTALAQRAGEVLVPSSHVVAGQVQPQSVRLVRTSEKPGHETVGFYGMERRKRSRDPETWSNPAQADPNWDPLSGPNQWGYKLNKGINVAVEQPVTTGYRAITTKPIRKSVRNFVTNLATPVSVVNQAAQGKTNTAGVDATRFITNSTLGLLGLFDVADEVYGIRPVSREDFGQTLAHYGVPAGPPIEVPLVGQSNPRDVAGLITDILMAPEVTPGAKDTSNFGPGLGILARIAVLDSAGPTAAFPQPKAGQTAYTARRDASITRRNAEIRR